MTRRGFEAIVLDMDEIIAKTLGQHARSWQIALKELNLDQSDRVGNIDNYIEKKPLFWAIKDFLNSQKIDLPKGTPEDSPELQTVSGLLNKQNDVFLNLIDREGINVSQDAVDQVKKWRDRGLKIAVVSGGKNGREILNKAGVGFLFDLVIDAEAMEKNQLTSKPFYETLRFICDELQIAPESAVLIEDTVEGVKAGKEADYGLVVGLTRSGSKRELIDNGADIVVDNFQDIKSIGLKKSYNYAL